MKKVIYSSGSSSQFSTFLVKDVESLIRYPREVAGAKRYVADPEERRRFSDEIFKFIDEAYDELGGFRSFKDMDHFINDSYLWYITYEGPEPQSELLLDISKVYVISVYRQKFGLKLVGLAGRRLLTGDSSRADNVNVRAKTNAAVTSHLQFMAKRGWAEVSDKLETWCKRVLGPKYIIPSYELVEKGVFPNIVIDDYDDHYERPLRKGGPTITKIAYGTLKTQ